MTSDVKKLIGVLLAGTLAAGPLAAETLDDAWNAALSGSRVLEAARATEEAADAAVSAAERKHLPSVDLQANYLRLEEAPQMRFMGMSMPLAKDRTYGYGAVATLPVFAGGRIVSGVEAAKALKARAGSELRGAEQDVKMKVAERYVNVLQAQRALELAELHERTLQAHAADVEKLFKKGFVVKTDRLAAEVWVKNARQDVIRARNALSLAKSAYNREIGRPLDAEARLEEPALPEVLQGGEATLVERAVRKNAAIEGIRHADAALAAQAKAEKGAYLPQVALAGGWMRQDDPYLARDRGWMVGVTMKWNILDGGVRAANVTEIGKKRAALEHQKAEAGSLVELAVRQCLLNVNEADERLGVAQSALAQADENLRAVRERYRHGLVSHTEVLDAETLRLSSDMNAMYAHYDAVLAGLRLSITKSMSRNEFLTTMPASAVKPMRDVAENSFLLIDFVIDNLRLGMPLKEAVLKAGSVRMRPILLTSLCVVCGSLIMLTDAVFRGLTISLIFGTLVSACCTVFVVPILLYQYYKAFTSVAAAFVPSSSAWNGKAL